MTEGWHSAAGTHNWVMQDPISDYLDAFGEQGATVAPELNWFDVLEDIIYKEPVAVRGSFGFGLTELASALGQPGLREAAAHALSAVPTRAISAMAGAYSAAAEATERGCALQDAGAMARIIDYAEASCRSMSEIVGLLRGRAVQALRLAA